jgi:hypothetical protein
MPASLRNFIADSLDFEAILKEAVIASHCSLICLLLFMVSDFRLMLE